MPFESYGRSLLEVGKAHDFEEVKLHSGAEADRCKRCGLHDIGYLMFFYRNGDLVCATNEEIAKCTGAEDGKG